VTSKSKFIAMLITVFIGFILFQAILFVTHKTVNRSEASLWNQYYRLKASDPLAAKHTLEILIKQYPHDQVAIRELAYWYFREGDIKSSIEQFEKVYSHDNRDVASGLQLGKLYMMLHQTDKAYRILSKVAAMTGPLASQAKTLLNELPTPTSISTLPSEGNQTSSLIQLGFSPKKILSMQQMIHLVMQQASRAPQPTETSTSPATPQAKAKMMSERDKMMNAFYDLKREHSPKAWEAINSVLISYPNDVQAWKEAAYYALITLNNNALSEYYFVRAYQLTGDAKLALQLGYVYDNLKQKHKAYYYFDLATHTSDIKDRMTAELAKTNLRGVQTIFLPYPFYAALDFSPLYMSRFKLMIYPIIFRMGMTLNERFNWKAYLSYRRTSDNKSNTSNIISNIFEDDAAITAIGSQLTPLPFAPQLVVFAEVGKAIDLVYRKRARYRNDWRGGLVYYNEWGRPAQYTLKPTLMLQFNADIYGEAIYYNRYHDGIATLRLRPGVKVFRYGSMSLDLYYRAFIIEDQARQFYNNIFENGPGLAFRLSDRYNIVFRYEQIHGRYLPASSPSRNPYSMNYHNTVTRMDTYFEF
jgi:hypothetical protein